ncbi:MAG: YqaJ viral recombinase family protein [Phreatobacter sp.]|uniref:YqaJ viral recombinase family protein n=1 Tax=Phreatobacter sp. TaxID=1966341 RepID=UPI001A611BA2|nr:YqaJ viral recombinase family protein [Phreatobacter sp.]MBL8571963.1 YqaJ viral recombinase family protein [Phreatobacter sp.]
MSQLNVSARPVLSIVDQTGHLPSNSDDVRRSMIGGSDARVIMGSDEKALRDLWLFKRGLRDGDDLSGSLPVQLGICTEDLNRRWFERQTRQSVSHVQQRIFDRDFPYLAATLDGLVGGSGHVFEAKFMLPWSFSEEAAAEKHMPQLQHNMAVSGANGAQLSIITGGGRWVLIEAEADAIYQAALREAEVRFWDCVKTGRAPSLIDAPPPLPKAEVVRIADMNSHTEWCSLAGRYRATKQAHDEHLQTKEDLKGLVPRDAVEAIGAGLRAKRSKTGALSFELLR